MRLLLDEMYSSKIAERLRQKHHDVVSVAEREDLSGRPDAEIFAAALAEGRAVLTNNVDDYVCLANATLAQGGHHSGLLFTSDKSLPRNRTMIGRYVRVLEPLLLANPSQDALVNQVRWLR